MSRWHKAGKRTWERNHVDYNAIIFGAAEPQQVWAWAVWNHGPTLEGVEFGLNAARIKANAAIETVLAVPERAR